jgi:hypothetical protein
MDEPEREPLIVRTRFEARKVTVSFIFSWAIQAFRLGRNQAAKPLQIRRMLARVPSAETFHPLHVPRGGGEREN